ncbi:MAG: cytochrome b/b6 domain-containing protein [Pseudomonadota bacterium]
MAYANSSARFGSVSKSLHWLTVLLIFTVIPLGILAHDHAYDTSEALARKALLFSLHKTVGITIFFVALARIAWALSQPKPGLLHADRKVESCQR